jgi:ankyrin repeat protein
LFRGESALVKVNKVEEVEAGAYVNAWDEDGRTPLFLAARAGHTESAIALVEGGAQIDLSRHTDEGRSAVIADITSPPREAHVPSRGG